MKTKVFRVRFEELPALGEFVEASFLHDKDLFAAFSPRYANGFAEEYHNKLLAVKNATMPHLLTSRMKHATELQYAAQDSMLILLRNIERYWEMTNGSLTVKIDDLKLKALKKNLKKRDAEAVVQGAKAVLQTLQPCLPVLQEHGFSKDKADEFAKLIEVIESNNLEQNNLFNQRRRLVEENLTLWNEFWTLVREVMKTGKLIHHDNPVRKSEYTETNIRSRVRLATSKKANGETEIPVEPPDREQPAAA